MKNGLRYKLTFNNGEHLKSFIESMRKNFYRDVL